MKQQTKQSSTNKFNNLNKNQITLSHCKHKVQSNQLDDKLSCQLCINKSHEEPLQTAMQREQSYEIEMERVTQHKLKKTVSNHIKTTFEQQQEPLNQKELSPSFYSHRAYDDSDDEKQEKLKEQQNELREAIRMHNHDIKAKKKIIVGSGFTFDMTDFFNFKKKQLGYADQQNFLQTISGSRIAWIILLYTIVSSAFIPGWIMSIKANKFLRQCWRSFMQTLMVIPFVLYEKRTASQQDKQKYTLKYIFDRRNIVKPFMSSFSASLWILGIFMSFQWTYVCHGVILGSLSNFFLSLNRSINKSSHDLQSGGQILVLVGIVLLIIDGLSLSPKQIQYGKDYMNTFFLTRTWWQRLGGNMLALSTSLMMSQFSKYTSDLKNYFPPFLSMLIVNIFNVITLTLISFFFNGTSFDQDPFWGIFSVFTDTQFITFMYMAIILAFGQLISVVLVTRMFPDPIIPALAMTLQPFFACFFIDLTGIQSLPSNFQIGFILLLPGMFIILMGQCFYQRQKSYQEESDRRVKHLLDEIKQLKQTIKEREEHQLLKRRRLSEADINIGQSARQLKKQTFIRNS